jgi:hypothetical protein
MRLQEHAITRVCDCKRKENGMTGAAFRNGLTGCIGYIQWIFGYHQRRWPQESPEIRTNEFVLVESRCGRKCFAGETYPQYAYRKSRT